MVSSLGGRYKGFMNTKDHHKNNFLIFLNPNLTLKLNPKLDFRFLRDEAAKELKESKGSPSLINQVF